MIKVSDVVEELVSADGFIQETMREGVLNISAYAKKILPQVEERSMKPVRLGTVVVALSRLMRAGTGGQPLRPDVTITNVSVKTSLCEVTYEKTERVLANLSTLSTPWVSKGEFFTVTEGLAEITIICPQSVKKLVTGHFDTSPKAAYDNLVAVSIRFSPEYMSVPNTIYAMVSAVAVKHINIIEIVSTYTELSFIILKEDMERTIQAINPYFQK